MGRKRNPPKDEITEDDSGSGSSSHDHVLEEGDAPSASGELSDVNDTRANNNQPLEREDDDDETNNEGTKKKQESTQAETRHNPKLQRHPPKTRRRLPIPRPPADGSPSRHF